MYQETSVGITQLDCVLYLDLLQGRPELAEGYWLLCLGYTRDPPCQACW